VVGAGKVATGEEPDRLEPARIRGIEHRQTVGEHVADVEVPSVHHDLHSVGPAADVAVGKMPDALPDPLRRNWNLCGGSRLPQDLAAVSCHERHAGETDE
jgi:hypothetical protein